MSDSSKAPFRKTPPMDAISSVGYAGERRALLSLEGLLDAVRLLTKFVGNLRNRQVSVL
jgi:hypothetical protein